MVGSWRPARSHDRSGPGRMRRVGVSSRIWRAAAAAALIVGLATPSATGADAGGATGGAAPPGTPSKSRAVQDAAWLAAKTENRVRISAGGPVKIAEQAPAALLPVAKRLVTSVTQLVVEPPGSGVDDRGTSFVDLNYWNFCAPGGATVAAYYFGSSRVTGQAAGYFVEPYGPRRVRTYWASADTASGYATRGRAYLMYIAEQVFPPGWATPGLAEFSYYPTTGATLPDTRDAINWEISGHSPGWASYYYAVQPTYGARFSEAQLHTDIAWAVGYDNVPIVAAVNTGYLPNWSRALGHTITIVGYDDVAGTYTYLDTCGKLCNGSAGNRNGGLFTIGRRALYLAIAAWGTGYLY
jgi:hypothetical protein